MAKKGNSGSKPKAHKIPSTGKKGYTPPPPPKPAKSTGKGKK